MTPNIVIRSLLYLTVFLVSIQGVYASASAFPGQVKKKSSGYTIRKKACDWIIQRKVLNRWPAAIKDDGKTAKILGVISLISMLVPVFGLFSIALAIIAIVKGKRVLKKDPLNKDAKTAVLLGWISLGVFVAFLAIFGLLIFAGLLI